MRSSYKVIHLLAVLGAVLILSCTSGGRSVYEEALSQQEEADYAQAIELYEQVIAENPGGIWVEQAKERIKECKAMLIYFDAHTALGEGDITKSKELRREAEGLYLYEPDSLYLQGMYDLFEGEFERAELSFLKLLHDYPAVHLGYLGMAHLDYSLGRLGNAIKNVDKAIRYTNLLPEKEEGEELLITLCQELVEEADYMDRIADLLPATTQNPWVYYYVGYSLNHRPEPQNEQAVSILARGLSNKDLPERLQADLSAELALAYLVEGYGDKALRYIDKALGLYPDDKEYKSLKRRIEKAVAEGLLPKKKKPEKPEDKTSPLKLYPPFNKQELIEEPGK